MDKLADTSAHDMFDKRFENTDEHQKSNHFDTKLDKPIQEE